MSTLRKTAWGVRTPEDGVSVLTVSFDLHDTPEEAIEAFTRETGKPWEECVREGAELVRHEIIERKPPNSRSI